MARCRNIKPGFFLNDLLAEVDPLGRILFIGLWTIADREGRLEDRPRKIKAEILPYDDCDIELLLTDLHEKDFIVRYEINGEKYIWIKNFQKHQNPHFKENQSVIPEYYPQCCPQRCPQNRPQADNDEQMVSSKVKPATPTPTIDTAIPQASTGNSDTFPAESFILNPESPILIPELFIPESGAKANLGSDSEPEVQDEDAMCDGYLVEIEPDAPDKSLDPVLGRTGATGITKTAAAAAMEKELGRSLKPLEYEQVLNYELQRKGKGCMAYVTSSGKDLKRLYEL